MEQLVIWCTGEVEHSYVAIFNKSFEYINTNAFCYTVSKYQCVGEFGERFTVLL